MVKRPLLKTIGYTAATVVTVVAALRMGHGRPLSGGPIHHYVGINASASNSQQLGGSLYLLGRLAGMIEERDFLSIWRVDKRVRRLLEGHAPSDTEVLQAQLRRDLEPLAVEEGTCSLEFFRQAARTVPGDDRAVLTFFTDGFEEGTRSAEIQALRETGRQLAACRGLRAVHLVGVAERARPFWTEVFRDLGPRLHVSGPLRRNTIEQIEVAAEARD